MKTTRTPAEFGTKFQLCRVHPSLRYSSRLASNVSAHFFGEYVIPEGNEMGTTRPLHSQLPDPKEEGGEARCSQGARQRILPTPRLRAHGKEGGRSGGGLRGPADGSGLSNGRAGAVAHGSPGTGMSTAPLATVDRASRSSVAT